ncbi:MAG: trehalose-6-phosphate synthase [Desulfovibrionaceae bacterium]|nr:trehalose-6-phosphate synthase [Desulfovibrionaceae bacterium]
MTEEPIDPQRLVVISNRLPVALKKVEGRWKLTPGSGGLVSAMAPVLRDRGGTWIGWTGTSGDVDKSLITDFSRNAGYDLRPVPLEEEEVRGFYQGFSNEIIWPLFHGFQSRCNFEPNYWHDYLTVNRKFAEQAQAVSGPGDYIWVHDYHLMHVAWWLRQMGCRRNLGFFLHIPFPPVDIFVTLPWRAKIIQALLEFDLVGFHTYRDRRNFIQCVNLFNPGAKTRGRGPVVTLTVGERTTRVGFFPIGIDYKAFSDTARKKSVVEEAHEFQRALRKRTIILGVDRLDYSKGIPERFEAIRETLKRYPELIGKISLVQVVVPSREEVGEYKALKDEIERLVGEINGEFTRPGYIPIHYQYRSLGREELIAYYRAASMALVTPLRDGMNLVAKEYCACNPSGVLFLSEFAGAAAQLQNGALLVNPYDVVGVAKAIHRAYHMEKAERSQRMRKMRETVRKYHIFWWVDSFLRAGFGRTLDDFPQEMTGVHFASEMGEPHE